MSEISKLKSERPSCCARFAGYGLFFSFLQDVYLQSPDITHTLKPFIASFLIKIIPVSIRRSTEHEPCTEKLQQFLIKSNFFSIHLDYIYSKPSDFSLMCMTRRKQYNLKAICFRKRIKVFHGGARNYLRKLYHSPHLTQGAESPCKRKPARYLADEAYFQ